MTGRFRGYRVAFLKVGEAERACQKLIEAGLAPQQITMTVRDETEYSSGARSGMEEARLNRWLVVGEAVGLVLGVALGIAMLLSGGSPPSPQRLPLLVGLLILATWALCGSLMGAMLGSLCCEALLGDKERHPNFALEVLVPVELEAHALRVLKQAKGLEGLEPSDLRRKEGD